MFVKTLFDKNKNIKRTDTAKDRRKRLRAIRKKWADTNKENEGFYLIKSAFVMKIENLHYFLDLPALARSYKLTPVRSLVR